MQARTTTHTPDTVCSAIPRCTTLHMLHVTSWQPPAKLRDSWQALQHAHTVAVVASVAACT
jgi:hypothetical protein